MSWSPGSLTTSMTGRKVRDPIPATDRLNLIRWAFAAIITLGRQVHLEWNLKR